MGFTHLEILKGEVTALDLSGMIAVGEPAIRIGEEDNPGHYDAGRVKYNFVGRVVIELIPTELPTDSNQ